jgi:hypothetical protein
MRVPQAPHPRARPKQQQLLVGLIPLSLRLQGKGFRKEAPVLPPKLQEPRHQSALLRQFLTVSAILIAVAALLNAAILAFF